MKNSQNLRPLPGLILATRSDNKPEYLRAFLSHHLQVCERAVVLVDHRPHESPQEAANACLHFGERVHVITRADEQFHNGRTCDALQEVIAKIGVKAVLHLDKDEFCKNLHDIEPIYRNIVSGNTDYAEGRMICRFAIGGNLYSDQMESFEEWCRAAPVRSHVIHQYANVDVKCFMTRAPMIRIHYGDKGWRKDKIAMPLEHFRWTFNTRDKSKVKNPQHPQHLQSSNAWRDNNVCGRTGDFFKKLKRGFRPNSHGISGWMDYGDVYQAIAEAIPAGGTFCEVGVFKGKSLTYFGEYLALIGKPATAIGYDWFNPDWKTYTSGASPMKSVASDDWMHEVATNLDLYCPWNTPQVRRHASCEAASQHADRSVDAVWLDAGHDTESVKKDLLAWMPKIKLGGILAGHDINMYGVRAGLAAADVKWRKASKSSWIATGAQYHDLNVK